MSENEIISFGYGLTPKTDNYSDYIHNGLKIFPFNSKTIKSSYVIVENDDLDLDEIAEMLRKELSDDVIAWCFIVSNVKSDKTRVLLVTKEYHLVQTIDKLLSRGKNIIPAVFTFLSAENNGEVTKILIERSLEIATMESCTSGLIASNITDYEGASAILKGSCITYSNDTKILAGVRREIIEEYGVYSPETAFEMALTAKMKFDANIGVGITGSFSNVDHTNKDSVAGVVYYQILWHDYEHPIKLVYHDVIWVRKEMKQKTVDIVFATLKTRLSIG